MTVPAPRGRGTTAPAGAVVVLTRQAVTDIPTIAIALVTLGLLRFKISEPCVPSAAGNPAPASPPRDRDHRPSARLKPGEQQ